MGFIDATHYSVRDNGVVRKPAAYVILAINCDGRKEVLSIEIGKNESAKYWLGGLNSLKNCGLKDILILCADGLTGLKDAVATATRHKTSRLLLESAMTLSLNAQKNIRTQ